MKIFLYNLATDFEETYVYKISHLLKILLDSDKRRSRLCSYKVHSGHSCFFQYLHIRLYL